MEHKTINQQITKKGGVFMKNSITKTEHKIGKITFLVYSSASENVSDTLEEKINKLIKKELSKSPETLEK